jgi:predicted metal-dependent hydrolase
VGEIKISKIIRSRRRSISLVIAPDATLIIRAPYRVSGSYLQDLVVRKAPWIIRKIKQAQRYGLAPQLTRAQEQVKFLEYKKEALRIMKERVSYYAKQTGWHPVDIKITNTRSRWASCSPRGVLRFSWRLVHAPLHIIDYVVVHELAHLVHKNHSATFWRAVENIIPEYREKRKWLRENKTFWNI